MEKLFGSAYQPSVNAMKEARTGHYLQLRSIRVAGKMKGRIECCTLP